MHIHYLNCFVNVYFFRIITYIYAILCMYYS